ncbi:MAG: glutathione S-transferase [Gammaproteobacteria bacterium]|nr:glutathione S-transferase [Gammaproteobacteria bacterium]
MITVHHLENSRSQRILWLLEELGLEYEIKLYKRDPKTMLAPKSLTKVHPLGKSPVIVDGDLTVAESGAIMDYLVDNYAEAGKLKPEEKSDLVKYRYWMHYAEGSLMPLLLMKLIFDQLSKPPMPLPIRPVAGLIAKGVKAKFVSPRIAQNIKFIEAELGKSRWFAGEKMSAADIQMSFPLEAAATRVPEMENRKNIARFLKRVHALPAYKRALERGGPYAYA